MAKGVAMARRRPEPAPRAGSGLRWPASDAGFAALLALLFAVLALWIYGPALSGPFVSDDHHYVATNPYIQELSWENLRAIADPAGDASVFVVNYTPVHLLLHALEWSVFEDRVTGYHVVNVLLHALGAALLGLLFRRAGAAPSAAALGALLFLVHPANVEAVAWISQLKTTAALPLALGALLAHPRRPLLGTLLFALALLAKPTAAFALPVALLMDGCSDTRIRWAWLGAWAALLVGYAGAEFWTHERSGAAAPISDDPWVRARSVASFAGRYLVMAATGHGVSAFQEPGPSTSWLDPWAWLGLLASLALGARTVMCLLQRRVEGAFWAWAAVSWLPISQIFPFLHPMADRYLYFILPGLIGAVLLAAPALGSVLERWRVIGPSGWIRSVGSLALAAGVAVAVVFGAQAHDRAALWRQPTRLMADSALHFPDGRTAHVLRARRAARVGDADRAVAELRAAWERGYNRFQEIQADSAYAAIRGDPEFRALLREIAGWWVDEIGAKPDPTQLELRTLAVAHLARDEPEAALRRLEQALAVGGVLDDQIRGEIERVRAQVR